MGFELWPHVQQVGAGLLREVKFGKYVQNASMYCKSSLNVVWEVCLSQLIQCKLFPCGGAVQK